MSNRAHLYFPSTDENGDLLRYTRVRIYEADGVTVYKGKIYRDRLSAKTWSNPFVAAPALIDAYLPAPRRIRLGLQPDRSKPEEVTEVIDVAFDADQSVTVTTPLRIVGVPPDGSLLCGVDEDTAYWKPLRVDHEHEMIAPRSVLVGPISHALRQAGGYPGTTVLGAEAGGWGAASSLTDSTMLGSGSNGYGRGSVAVGRSARAAEGENPPWRDASVALGRLTNAEDEGVAIGSAARSEHATVVGELATGEADALSIGLGSHAAPGGVALGRVTGALSRGPVDSVGIGAGAQYGLPSDQLSPAVMIGAKDPNRVRSFPWANPNSSQSESPYDEYAPTMEFAGRTVQLQRHLTWLMDSLGIQVDGDVTLGGPEGVLGFYGVAPRTKPSVGEDEPGSGITALDNLIMALRDLGLIKFRNEAFTIYRAEDMARNHLTGDLVPRWEEHFGNDVAVYSRPGVPPTFIDSDSRFNGYPSITFDNGVYRKSTKPVQEMRGGNLLPSAKHFLVVAAHRDWIFGYFEGLFNLDRVNGMISADATVLMSAGAGTTVWQADPSERYGRDGLDQSGNRDAGLPSPHVYRVTHRAIWPHSRPVIGGPRDQDNAGWDRWSGPIAEIVGLDTTWEEQHVASMVRGLMFRYGLNQDPTKLENPARDFLLTQHDPAGGTFVFWTPRPYADSFIGKVYGRATRVPKPVVYIPFISIYFSFSVFSFRGSLVGNWGNISISQQYEVDVSVKIGDLDNDGDLDVDVDVDFDSSTEVRIGVFSLNNNFTWSMGQLNSRYGYKICRIRHRVTKTVICISGDPPFRYADTEVRVYSTKPDGSLLLEGTSPLWGDGTFSVRVKNAGRKVARVYEVSTGNLLGTTEYHETALPRTTVYASDDPDVSTVARDRAFVEPAALAAMAFCDFDEDTRYRARHIAQTLAKIQNDSGSLNESYSSALPAKGAGTVSQPATIWAILAWLRYQGDTGDAQFLDEARKAGDWLITQLSSGSLGNTARTAQAYFALRDLGTVTGVASYTNAATAVRGALLGQHWSATGQRFGETATNDREALDATVYGGLFLLAIGDRAKARACIRHLKRFRVKDRTVSASHYAGPGGLIGYKPYADLGTTPYVNPPNIIDQAGTWVAILFKSRYGEPIGDDVSSMLRWDSNYTVNDPGHVLFGEQFLSYSASVTAAPYGLRARPNLAAAAWGYLLSQGARRLFPADPLPAPTVTNLAMVATRDFSAGRVSFRYTWTATGGPSSAYSAVPEQSIDAGGTWSPVAATAVSAPMETARDVTAGAEAYSATWSIPVPENVATLYRVRLRLRNASFGPWVTSTQVGVPSA